MLDTEIKIVWKGNCNYSWKKFEHKSQNSNMNALDNPHFVIKNWQMIKTKIWSSWENTWHFVTSPMGNGIWRTTTEITFWSSVMTHHYPDLVSPSHGWKFASCHQYEVSAFVLQTSFCGKPELAIFSVKGSQ